MDKIIYIDRTTGLQKIEEVYGGNILTCLYGNSLASRLIGRPLAKLIAYTPLLSRLYGWLQKQPRSKKKILPFIQRFNINTTEFLNPPDTFHSFNDFFIRKLKPETRPINPSTSAAIIPADGRYRFFPNISTTSGFYVKGEKFSLNTLLQDNNLATKYASGTMVIARLCPTDYHRFHFPCNGIPSTPTLINGPLFSVNPIALRKNIQILSQNKRMITKIQTNLFGEILYLEIGATNVGSIHETYSPNTPCKKGNEKGFFSFGGSALILLFPPNTITLSTDLLQNTDHEIYCQMGQLLGYAHATDGGGGAASPTPPPQKEQSPF